MRPLFELAGAMAFFAALLTPFMLLRNRAGRQLDRLGEAALEEWADREGYEVVAREICWFDKGPFWFSHFGRSFVTGAGGCEGPGSVAAATHAGAGSRGSR